MKFTIEYEETVKKINSIDIEVESEEEGEEIAEVLEEQQGKWHHPDDIKFAIEECGVKIVDQEEGCEDCSYELI